MLWVAARVLPESGPRERVGGLDLVGILLLTLAVIGVELPLLQGGSWGGRTWWLAWTGHLLLVLFVLWERAAARRARQPLIDPVLFRARTFWVGTAVAGAIYGGFTGIFVPLMQFLQQGMHDTALKASQTMVMFTLGSAVCGILSGRVVHRAGRALVIGGTALTAAGLLIAALAVGGATPGNNMVLRLSLPLLVVGCGAGCVIAANQTLALHPVPRHDGSTAAGVYQTGMKLGTSLGTALAASLYFGGLVSAHQDYAAAARDGLLGAAGLCAVAFMVALPGLTLGRRRTASAVS
ncbi:MFS family permease [Streptacidiphilus sp. MAP12-33]